MTQAAVNYTRYFKEDAQTKIGVKLADNKLLDVSGVVRVIKGDLVTLELVGAESPDERIAEPGSDVFVTVWTGWSLCRCNAKLTQKIYGRRVFLRLTGPVSEKQTREFFRFDVSIPLTFSIPETQMISAIREEWDATRELRKEIAAPLMASCPDGFKVVRWNGRGEIAPHQINLSGGGLRFRSPEHVTPGTLIIVDLFLPLAPPKVIHTVVETLRCTEIMLGRTTKGSNYITAARFHHISEKGRETIIAYIFAEQRRLLNVRGDKR